jgi:hypothetical protein
MVEGSRRQGLLVEALARLLVLGGARGEELERDLPTEDGVFGDEDFPHPSRSDSFEDPVLRERSGQRSLSRKSG